MTPDSQLTMQFNRPSAARRGYGHRWREYRERYLREHPLCVQCEREGRQTPATEVDHTRAVTGPNDPLFWSTSNHQALCKSHHSRKTAVEDGGFGRRRRANPAILAITR